MIPDLDICRAAKLLVEGAAVWRAIMAAIEELQRGRYEGEPLN